MTGRSLKKLRAIGALTTIFATVFSSVVFATSEPKEVTLSLGWQMRLNAEGRIVTLVPDSSDNPVLRKRLENAVKGWKFSLSGKPAAAETHLTIQVGLHPNADGQTFAIDLLDARTGASVSHATPIRLPEVPEYSALVRSAQRNGGAEQIVVEIGFNGSGKPTQIETATGTTSTNAAFIHAVRVAARRMRFKPEKIDGKEVQGKMLLMYCFTARPKGTVSTSEPCSWDIPGSRAKLETDQPFALESRIKVESDLLGSSH